MTWGDGVRVPWSCPFTLAVIFSRFVSSYVFVLLLFVYACLRLLLAVARFVSPCLLFVVFIFYFYPTTIALSCAVNCAVLVGAPRARSVLTTLPYALFNLMFGCLSVTPTLVLLLREYACGVCWGVPPVRLFLFSAIRSFSCPFRRIIAPARIYKGCRTRVLVHFFV